MNGGLTECGGRVSPSVPRPGCHPGQRRHSSQFYTYFKGHNKRLCSLAIFNFEPIIRGLFLKIVLRKLKACTLPLCPKAKKEILIKEIGTFYLKETLLFIDGHIFGYCKRGFIREELILTILSFKTFAGFDFRDSRFFFFYTHLYTLIKH